MAREVSSLPSPEAFDLGARVAAIDPIGVGAEFELGKVGVFLDQVNRADELVNVDAGRSTLLLGRCPADRRDAAAWPPVGREPRGDPGQRDGLATEVGSWLAVGVVRRGPHPRAPLPIATGEGSCVRSGVGATVVGRASHRLLTCAELTHSDGGTLWFVHEPGDRSLTVAARN